MFLNLLFKSASKSKENSANWKNNANIYCKRALYRMQIVFQFLRLKIIFNSLNCYFELKYFFN